jgi:enterochelin esterase-like enzyme
MREPLASVTGCGDGGPACAPVRIFLGFGLPEWDVGDHSALAGALEATGYDIEVHQPREGHTWDQWRGLADEMLTFLFPPTGS